MKTFYTMLAICLLSSCSTGRVPLSSYNNDYLDTVANRTAVAAELNPEDFQVHFFNSPQGMLVEVADQMRGTGLATIGYSGNIYVNQNGNAWDGEIEFIIAHEICHKKLGHHGKGNRWFFSPEMEKNANRCADQLTRALYPNGGGYFLPGAAVQDLD